MAETFQQTQRRRSEERRSFTGVAPQPPADELRQGYRRGFEPAAPVRRMAEAPGKPVETGLSRGVIPTEEKSRRRRAKIARGEPLTQEDLE